MARIARPSVMGFELCDAIMSEHRHRVNQRASRRRRPDFPDVGHYDSWLVDALQNIVEETRGALYYSGWANSTDYVNTDETFGVVPLASNTLIDKVNSLELAREPPRLSRDKTFYAARTGLVIPALPFTTPEEKKLYPKLVLHVDRARMTLYNGMSHDEAVCHAILQHVNGVNIFPKLAVYVRLYARKKLKNDQARDCSNQMTVEIEQLHQVNIATAGVVAGVVAQPENEAILTVGDRVGPSQSTKDKPMFLGIPSFGHLTVPVAPRLPSTFIGILGINVGCIPGPIVVGNIRVDTGGICQSELDLVGSKPRRKRGLDKSKRLARTCRRCGRNGLQCDGAKAGKYGKGVEDCKQNTKIIDGAPIVCRACGKVGFNANETCPGAKMSRNGAFQQCKSV